jgi:O-antigen/teichoic acid export membrane protein/SAM-dependent methyltransferase
MKRLRLAEAITTPDPLPAGGRTLAARGALWLSVGSWGAKGMQTVVLLVLAQALAPSEFGILAIAALTYNVLQAVNQLGVGDALTYLADRIEEASRTALSMVLVAGLILMGATWALAPAIASFFHSPDATFVIRGFSVCLPFDAAAQVPIGRLTRSLSFSRRAVTDTLPSIIGAAVTIGVVLSGYPLIGLVAGQIAGSTANAAVAMLVGPRCLPGWSTVMARRLLRYGGFLSAADLVNLGLLNVDYIIVGHVLGPEALGLYSLAYRICFMPYLSFALVANGAVFPYYCRLPSREAIARTAESTFCLITALSIPWFAGLVLFAGDIALLGAKWAPAAGAVRFLAVYGLFLSLILSGLQVLKAVGRSDLVFFGRGLHLAILTVVLLGTVRRGITFVALDQALVACAIAAATGLWIVRYAALRPAALARSVGLPLLGALGMVSVVLLLSRIPGVGAAPSWTSLLVLGPLAFAVFAAVALLIMPGPLRQGWAALRGRSDTGTPLPAQAGPRPGEKARRWWSMRPNGERTVKSMNSARKTAEQAADNLGLSSYRDSHVGAEKARSYDEDLWDLRAAKGLDWLVEQRLLADIIQPGRVPEPRSVADFACGTGRVLEFLSRNFPAPVGIDISPDMLALAHDRCPRATVILGDVTTRPELAPGPFDLITAFRFFLNAEPSLQREALAWMRASLRPGGLVVANFHLNPRSLRGAYLRLRLRPAARPAMTSVEQARQLFGSHGFAVRTILGYSFLPYRRDGRSLLAPLARRAVELRLAGSEALLPVAGSFLLVAAVEPSGPAE